KERGMVQVIERLNHSACGVIDGLSAGTVGESDLDEPPRRVIAVADNPASAICGTAPATTSVIANRFECAVSKGDFAGPSNLVVIEMGRVAELVDNVRLLSNGIEDLLPGCAVRISGNEQPVLPVILVFGGKRLYRAIASRAGNRLREAVPVGIIGVGCAVSQRVRFL